jgi:hypothetical protein
MKRVGIILSVLLITGCVGGLNKPITEELSVGELRSIMRRDTTFIASYDFYRDIGDWLLTDNVQNAKYGKITYKQLHEYEHYNLPYDEVKAEYQKAYPKAEKLRVKADSLLRYYRSIQPDSLVTLTFKSKSTRRTYLGNFPIFIIEVKPLKGRIEQFSFEYYFSTKISGDKKIEDVPYSLLRRGYQNTPVSKATVIGYSGELWTDTLEDVSNDALIRDYDFLYKITNVRYKGKNWNDLPFTIRYALEKEPPYSEYVLDSVIEKLIDNSYVSFSSFYSDKNDEASAKKYPTTHAMYETFFAKHPDYE